VSDKEEADRHYAKLDRGYKWLNRILGVCLVVYAIATAVNIWAQMRITSAKQEMNRIQFERLEMMKHRGR
jgi:hypothetical protein